MRPFPGLKVNTVRTCTAAGHRDQKPSLERWPFTTGWCPAQLDITVMMMMVVGRYSEIKDYTFGQEPRGGPTTGVFSEEY